MTCTAGCRSSPTTSGTERRVEEERADLGIAPYAASAIPPATDVPVPTDVTESLQYQEALAEVRRQRNQGELLVEGASDVFPPTHYGRD